MRMRLATGKKREEETNAGRYRETGGRRFKEFKNHVDADAASNVKALELRQAEAANVGERTSARSSPSSKRYKSRSRPR